MKKSILTLSVLLTLSSLSYAKEPTKVVAEVNGIKITEQQLEEALKSVPPNMKNVPNLKGMVLDNLIKEDLLYSEALKENLENDPEVKKALAAAKKRILILYLLKKHVKPPKVEISDAEVKAFYEKNKKVFSMNGKPIDFNSLKPRLKEVLLENKRKEAYIKSLNEYIKKLKASSKVKVFTNK